MAGYPAFYTTSISSSTWFVFVYRFLPDMYCFLFSWLSRLHVLDVLGDAELGISLLLDLVNSDAVGQLGKSQTSVLAVNFEDTL